MRIADCGMGNRSFQSEIRNPKSEIDMLCEDCKTNEATVPFIQIVDNKKTVHHLCAACAEKRSGGATSVTVTLSGVVASEEEEEQEAPVPDLTCAFCGMTYAEFKKAGRFGCDGCYLAFGSELEAMFKRIHGATRHAGGVSAPAAPEDSAEDIEALLEALRKAVAEERFEEAARLRDRVTAARARGTGVPP